MATTSTTTTTMRMRVVWSSTATGPMDPGVADKGELSLVTTVPRARAPKIRAVPRSKVPVTSGSVPKGKSGGKGGPQRQLPPSGQCAQTPRGNSGVVDCGRRFSGNAAARTT
eukprot:6275903-Heterocapsa_arctica.AAC.1